MNFENKEKDNKPNEKHLDNRYIRFMEMVMFKDVPYDFSPPPIWSDYVGNTIKEMCKENIINRMYLDQNEMVRFEPWPLRY